MDIAKKRLLWRIIVFFVAGFISGYCLRTIIVPKTTFIGLHDKHGMSVRK